MPKQFVNGKATLKFALNTDLTSKNNPRHDIAKSLSQCGNIFIVDAQDNTISKVVDFSAIFYETDEVQKQKVDWVSDVSPILKMMGLLYPSMQNIVDLYNFENVSMSAMKRAFDIED